MPRLSAQELYNRLLQEHIYDLTGQIRFELGDVNIIVKQRDVVGNIIQEWLQGWLDLRRIEYSVNENTQMPPDFFLDPTNLTHNMLEVKAFYRNASPGFDIADFRMYEEEIIERPYMLDVDYLIFGYDMSDDGIVTVRDLWLKKVWEITRRMENWPLNLQVKAGVVHKIRPGVWYTANTRQQFRMFNCLEDFVSAIEETVYQNPRTHDAAATWRTSFSNSFFQFYQRNIIIPRWQDIRDNYVVRN